MEGGKNEESGESSMEKLDAEAEKLEADAHALEEVAEKLQEEAEKLEDEAEDLENEKVIDVVFNEKYPVKIHGKNQTGLSLKEAAIAQKVPIQLDFVLSIERGGGKTDLIGDAEHIKVKEGDRFLAIPNDDNS